MPDEFISGSPPGSEFDTNEPMAPVIAQPWGESGPDTYITPDDDQDAPPDVVSLFAEYGLDKVAYTCMLKRREGTQPVVESFNRCYPSVEWLQKNVGPGDYRMYFTWRSQTKSTKAAGKQRMSEVLEISIDESCRDKFEEHQLDKRLEMAKRRQDKFNRAKITKLLNPFEDTKSMSEAQVEGAAEKQLNQAMKLAEMMGMRRPDSAPTSGLMKEILPLLVPAIPAILNFLSQASAKRDEQFNKIMTLLLSQSNNASNNLVEIMKNNSHSGQPNKMLEDFFDMVKSTVDFKEMMTQPKESMSDKVFGMIENVAPAILQVMAQPKAVQAVDPRMAMAKAYVNTSPEFQEVMNNPRELQAMVSKLDASLGWEQTDQILSIAEVERPDSAPRMPGQRFPAGDDRNNEDAETETPQQSEPETPFSE